VKIKQSNRRTTMDTRKYSSGVIRPEDLHEGPRVEKIINIFEHEKHGCLVLELENGDQFYCWKNYARILSKAWGYESESWIDQELEFSLGHYTDKKTDPPTEKETIDVRAVSPAKPGTNGGAPSKAIAPGRPASLHGPMDDDIPFMCEWR
jgi:hypothetical protein